MNNIRRTILAAASNHEHIIKDKLEDKGAILGTSIIPFNVYLNQFSTDQQDSTIKYALAYQAIQTIKDECLILSHSLKYPEIVQQFINFTTDCIKHGISFSSLPNNTQKEKDVAVVVGALWPIFENIPNFDTIQQKVLDASHLEIYPFNHSIDEKKVIEYLHSVGATLFPQELVDNPSTSVFYALNHAKEAEAVAQHILKQDDLKTLIVCCDTSLLPTMLEATFMRYNIRFSSDLANSTPVVVTQLLSLIALIQTLAIDDLIECIHNNVFILSNPIAFLEYVRIMEVTSDDLFKPFNHYHTRENWNILGERDVSNLTKLEKEAEIDRQVIVSHIQSLSSSPIPLCFDFIAKNYSDMNQDNQQALLSLKDIIEKLSTLNLDSNVFDIVFNYLALKVMPSPMKQREVIHLTTLEQSYQPGYDQVIIVSANQQNYPGFSKQSGIIDEQYLLSIPFPSLENRLNHHMSQLQHLLKLAPNVIVSYSTSSFDGKSKAEAYELIEKIPGKAKAWNIHLFGKNQTKDFSLTPNISQQLFLNNNDLYGSVSSFEVFFNCQYRYFLKSGLKLSEVDPEPLLVALVGSISHAIVELLINNDKKHYAQVSFADLESLILHYFLDLHTVYPKRKEYWDFIAERLTHQLFIALDRLNTMEEATDFTFDQAEYLFQEVWVLPNHIKLNLKGFIDRIDKTSEFFRIIDYKSSEKNLSYAQVKAGLQLQLLTYLVVADATFKEKASGAFYYSFLNKNVDIIQQKLSRGKLITYSKVDELDDFYKLHKLSGWFVDKDASSYQNGFIYKHITSKGNISKTGLFDLEKIKSYFTLLYTHLSDQLSEGKIDRNPVIGACDYCEFKHICIFKGTYQKPIDLDPENTLKEGEDDVREEY